MLVLTQSLMLNSLMLFALNWQGSEVQRMTGSLSPQELRENLTRLVELESLRAENKIYRDYVQRETALAAKEKANSDEALRLKDEALKLSQRETALQKERADFYENAYKTAIKKRSKKCTFFKIVTIGIARCS